MDAAVVLPHQHRIAVGQADPQVAHSLLSSALDAAVGFTSLVDNRRVLTPTGVYILVGGSGARFLEVMLLGRWRSKKGGQRFGTFVKQPTQQNLAFVRELLEAGNVRPVIDRCYPLQEAAEALRYLGARRARGKVVITPGQR